MKKVDSNNGVWVNDDPTTLTNGTPIDADFMNNIQDEISNVITDHGGTLDGTNHSQLSQTLDKTFAKLNSPTLIGVPLTSNPDGTINNQIATVDYVNQKALQATVGFTPTQQGGGTDQGANKIYIGGDSTDAKQVRVQVDQTDLGKVAFQAEDNNTYGVSKIGYDHTKNELAYYDTGNKAWHFSYTTDQIDSKAYISSLPTGDNTKITDIIWNTSSNLPAYYYGINNQVSYSATTDWVNENFATQTSLNNEASSRTSANQTLQNNINTEANTRSSAITNLQNSKANLAGGNSFTGRQDFNGAVTLYGGSLSIQSSTSALWNTNNNGFASSSTTTNTYGYFYCDTTCPKITFTSNGSNSAVYYFNAGGRLSSNAGTFALTSQIPNRFLSAQQAVQLEYIYSIPHNLGSVPLQLAAYLVCVAGEHGYAVGDKVLPTYWDGIGSSGEGPPPVAANASTITMPWSEQLPQVARLDVSSGVSVGDRLVITAANWRWVFFASL